MQSNRAYELVSGDFNHDGIPDVAFPAWGSNAVGVMLSQPNGDLVAARYFVATDSPDSIARGDFNHDGILDLVVASQNTRVAAALLGNGDGSFGSSLLLSASANGTASVSVGDFDGNGWDDIAIAAASGRNVDVFYNAVPEPASLSLLALGGLLLARRRRA